jgi:very-short-patch-repair endonuclease
MKFSQVHNLPEMKDYRRELRNKPTFAEKFLWDELKGKKLKGYKFRRQHSIANYIVDFYCPEYMLAIELDGEHHYDKYEKMYDDARTAFLNELKIKVIRFDNDEVVDNMSTVLIKIVEAINT